MCPIRYAVSLLEDYLQNMEEDEINARKLSFITEQLSLILKKPQNRRYSKNMILTAIILQSHSTACYESLLKADILTLPSVSSIRRICHGFQTETSQQMKSYLMSRRKNLSEFESTVVLIFDEMYVFETIDYSSNAFYGLATNKNAPASTILTFMVKSLLANTAMLLVCFQSTDSMSKFSTMSSEKLCSWYWKLVLIVFAVSRIIIRSIGVFSKL